MNNQSSDLPPWPERAFRIGGQSPRILPLSDWFSQRAVRSFSKISNVKESFDDRCQTPKDLFTSKDVP